MIDYKNINKVFTVNLLSTALGFINTILIGRYFGIGSGVSAYFAATILFGALAKVSQTGTISEYFFSRYFQVKKELGLRSAYAQYSILCNWLMLLTGALIIIGLIFSEVIMNFTIQGLDEATRMQSIRLFRILIFALPIQIIASLFQSLLNSEKIYGKSELSITLSMVISIVILLIWGQTADPMLLVYTTFIGGIVQLLFIFYLLKKLEYKHIFKLKSEEFGIRSISKGFTITSAYAVAVQVMTVCLTNSISKLPENIFPIYKYIETIYTKIAGVVLRPLGLSFYTNINNLVADSSLNIKESIRQNLNFSFLIGTAVLGISLLTAAPLISILWADHPVSVSEIQIATGLFQIYCFLVIIMGAHQVYRKLFIAVDDPRALYLIWIGEQLLITLCIYLFIPVYGYPAFVWIIIGHTILMTMAPMLLTYFRRRNFFITYGIRYAAKTIMAAGLAYGGTWILLSAPFAYIKIYNAYFGLFIGGSCFAILFITSAYFLKVPDVRKLFIEVRGQKSEVRS